MKKIKWKNEKGTKFYDINGKKSLDTFLKEIKYYLEFRRDTLCRYYKVPDFYYDDVLQEFFLTAISILKKYDYNKASFKTILHITLKNKIIDLLKNKKKKELAGKMFLDSNPFERDC